MKISFYIIVLFTFLSSCSIKQNKELRTETKDSIEAIGIDSIQKAKTGLHKEQPLDTIIGSYPNSKKLLLLVFQYYDSLPDKPIKDFEVREADTKDLIFRSVAKRLALGDEVDPINGRFDSLFVVPIYTISSKDPLTVELDFLVDGDFRIGYLGDVTYPFYENRPWNRLSFLSYTFKIINSTAVVKSSLRFTPHKCNLTETDLVEQFNNVKSKKYFYTDQGSNLIRQVFNCFLNGVNSHYEIMMNEFRKAMAPTPNDPYTYYPYITYLDSFIISLTYQ